MSNLLRIMIIALAILACSQGHALPGEPGETGVGLGSHGNHNHGKHGNHNHGKHENHGRTLPGMPGETGVRNHGNHKHDNHKHGSHKHGNHTHIHSNQGAK